MKKIIKIIIELMEKGHRRIFHYDLSSEMKVFLKNMSYAGLSSIITGIIAGIMQVVAVRVLGPVEYGKATLVFTVANFAPYFMLMGMQAGLSKYLSEKNTQRQRGSLITTGILGVLIFTCLTFLVAYLISGYALNIVGFSLGVYTIGVAYSVVTVLKTTSESILRGLVQFKTQAKLDIVYTSVAFLVFLIIYAFNRDISYIVYIFSFSAGLLVYAVIALIRQRQYLRLSLWSHQTFKRLLSYGVYSVIGSIALFILWGSDRFFVNKVLDLRSVGIYSVYYGTSLMVLGRFSSIFMKVFFPTASGRSDKTELNRRLGKAMLIGFLPLFLFNVVIMTIMLKIYGHEYPFNFLWIVLFSMNAILYTYVNSRGILIVSQGIRGHAFFSYWSLCMAAVAFILYLVMIPMFGLTGAILAVIIVSAVFFAGLSVYAKKLFALNQQILPIEQPIQNMDIARRSHWETINTQRLQGGTGKTRRGFLHWVGMPPSRYIFYRICDRFFLADSKKTVLEVGCAPGERIIEFAKRYSYIPYGVEYTRVGVDGVRAKFLERGIPEGNCIHSDVLDEAFQYKYQNTFDSVVSFGIIEHFTDVDKMINAHLNILKPGGTLLIMIPRLRGLYLPLTKFFAPKLIPKHNLSIMELTSFKKLFRDEKVDTIFCGYYGVLNMGMLQGEGAIKNFLVRGLQIAQAFINPILRKCHLFENWITSPYLLFIGIKNQD